MRLKNIWLCLALILPAFSSAQYFSNQGFQVPIVGWMGFDTTVGDIGPANPNNNPRQPWPTTDQMQIGFGYMHALLNDFSLWYGVKTTVGFGYAKHLDQEDTRIIFGLNVAPGLRYNFLEKRHRPFIHAGLEWLMLANTIHGERHWGGFQFGPGYEWIFNHNMGIQIEAAAHILTDFKNPFRFSWTTQLAYVLYF
ncbi:MAG: hypothetical protein O2897_00890 [bacterium]|nr:hypothetical protein [bacterium]